MHSTILVAGGNSLTIRSSGWTIIIKIRNIKHGLHYCLLRLLVVIAVKTNNELFGANGVTKHFRENSICLINSPVLVVLHSDLFVITKSIP